MWKRDHLLNGTVSTLKKIYKFEFDSSSYFLYFHSNYSLLVSVQYKPQYSAISISEY